MALFEDDPSFDPMQADFTDSKFNSYTEGKGKRLGNPNEVQEIVVLVENIPSDMNKQALLNIFSKFGEVEVKSKTKSKIQHNKDVAYLKFKTQIAANSSIRHIHKEPPFFLRVKFAPQGNQVRVNDNYYDSRIIESFKQKAPEPENQPKPDNIYVGPKLEEIRSIFFPADSKNNFITNDNFDPLYCNLFVSFYENKYKMYPILDENLSKFVSTAKKVSLGRCFYVENKEEAQMKQEHKEEAQMKQKTLTTGSKLGISKFRRCVLCPQKIAVFFCSTRCQTSYCSPECKTLDWPMHKLVCLSPTQNNCASKVTPRSLKVTHVEDNFIYAIKSEDLVRFETLKKRLQEECPKQPSCRLVSGGKCAVLDKDRDEWCRGLILEVSCPLSTVYFYDYGFSKQCMANSIQWLNSDLGEDEPYALKIKLLSESNPSINSGSLLTVKSIDWDSDAGYYSAALVENGDKSSISSSMSSNVSEFFRETEAKIIDLPCGQGSEDFTEVTIMGQLSPSTYYVSWNDLTSKDADEKMNAYIKIRWGDRQMVLPIGAKVNVRRSCRIASDFFNVEPFIIEEQNDLNYSRFSAVDWLEGNNVGKIQVTSWKRDNLFLAHISLDDKSKALDSLKSICKIVFNKINKTMKTLPEANDFVPKVGDCVAVYIDYLDYWTRGIVWSVSSNFVRCSLIDLGFVVSVHSKEVRALEKKFQSHPSFAVSCEVRIESGRKFELLKKSLETTCDFIVLERRSDSVLCCLLNGPEEVCTVELREWEPTAEEIGLKAVELKNKTKVQITQFYTSSLLHIRPVSQANFLINQKLLKLIQSSQPLKKIPRFGQLVACKWSKDNRYYRAQVFEPFKNSLYRIFFVDFGTQELSTLGDIYGLDEELLSYPCLSIKVSLKGVEEAQILDDKALKLLNSLGFKEEPLTIVFNKNDLSNVELYDLHGVSVNGEVKNCLKPVDVKEDEQFYCHQIVFDELAIGNEVELGLLSKPWSHCVYLMFRPNVDLAQFVFGTFQSLINDHCERLNSKGYTPRKGEVIFVQINTREMPEKCWCRAIVLESKHYGTFLVNCLDYGGMGDILVSSMRKMDPKFMVVPVVALTVVPKMPQDLAPSQWEKIDSFFSPFETYSGKVIARKDMEYCVEMEFLKDILEQL